MKRLRERSESGRRGSTLFVGATSVFRTNHHRSVPARTFIGGLYLTSQNRGPFR